MLGLKLNHVSKRGHWSPEQHVMMGHDTCVQEKFSADIIWEIRCESTISTVTGGHLKFHCKTLQSHFVIHNTRFDMFCGIYTHNTTWVVPLCRSTTLPRIQYSVDTQLDWICWSDQHYNDIIMGAIASQITSLTIVYSIVYSDADQRKHQSPGNSPRTSEFPAQMASKRGKCFRLMMSSWYGSGGKVAPVLLLGFAIKW